jgi:hypothetical protein
MRIKSSQSKKVPKETKEMRKARLLVQKESGLSMVTKIVKSQKIYNRKKIKNQEYETEKFF